MPADNNDNSISRFAGQVWDGLGWFASGLPHAIGDQIVRPSFRNAVGEWWSEANQGNAKKLPEGASIYRATDQKTGERTMMVKMPGQEAVPYREDLGLPTRGQLRSLQTTQGGFRGEAERFQSDRAAEIKEDYQRGLEVDRRLQEATGMAGIKKTQLDEQLGRVTSLEETRQRNSLALGDQKIQGEERLAGIRETGATQRQTISSNTEKAVAGINAEATKYGIDKSYEAKLLDFNLGERAEARLSLADERQTKLANDYHGLASRKQSSDEEYRNTVLGIQERNNRLNLIAQIFGNTTNNLASSVTAPYANLRF